MGRTFNQIKQSVLGKNFDVNNYSKTKAKKKDRTFDEIKSDVMSGKTDFSLVKAELEKRIGVDTFASDLSSVNKKMVDTQDNWQSQETLENTRLSIESIQNRLSAYKDYQRLFGGTDLSDLQKSYKSVLDGWDDISKHYGQYKDAGSYKKALKEYEAMKTDNLDSVQTEITDLEGLFKNASKYDDEVKALSKNSMSIRNPSAAKTFSELMQKAISNRDEYLNSIGYKSMKDLENDLEEKRIYFDNAKQLQDNIALATKDESMAASKEAMEGWKKWESFVSDREKTKAEDASALPAWIKNLGYIDNPTAQIVDMKMVDTSYQEPQDNWTQKEKNIFGAYFLENPESAYDYAAKLNNSKALTEKEKGKQKHSDTATSSVGSGAGATALSILSAPLHLADYLDDVTDIAAGRRVIVEEGHVTPLDYSNAVTSGISEKLNEYGTLNENIPVIGGKGLGDAYGLGTSILQSAVSGYTLGNWGTLVSYFGQGAASAIDDAISRGATPEQALTYGTIVGAAEGVSEKIGVDNLLKVGSSSTIKEFFVNVLKQSGAEGLEETFSSVVDKIADNFVMKDKSNFNALVNKLVSSGISVDEAKKKAWIESIEEIAFDTLSGALSGGIHAAPVTTVKTVQQHSFNKNMGQTIKANERVGEVFDIASNPEVASAYETYTRYAKKGINADNISDAQLGRLYTEARADAVSVSKSKKSSVEQKEVADKIISDLDTYGQYNPSARVNKKDVKSQYNDAESVDALISEGLESAEGTESHTLATEYKAKIDSGKKLSTDEILNLIQANEKAFKEEDSKGVTERLEELGESAEIADIVTRKVRGERITLDEAEKLNASENGLQVLAENVNEDLVGHVKAMENGANANLFISIYDGETDIEAYANDFNLVTEYAKLNYTYDSILQHKGVLSAKQVSAIYAETRIRADREKQDAINKLNEEMANLMTYKGFIDESIIDYENTSAEGKTNWKDLKPRQRKAITYVKGIAQASGMNLVLISNGKELGINGAYGVRDNTIYLDIHAGIEDIKHIDTIIPTMSHELTHWMEEKSPELWRKINEVVFSTLQRADGISEHDRIANEVERLKKKHKGQTVTEKDARSEIIARACEDMLSMSEEGKKLFNSLSESEQKTLRDKIKELIENFKTWVSELLSTYKSGSYEAKLMRQYEDKLNELSKLWDEMLGKSIKANQSFEKSGKFGHDAGVGGKILEQARELQKKDPTKLTEGDFKNLLEFAKEKIFADGSYIPARISTPQILISFAKEQGYELENYPLAMRVYKVRQALSNDMTWDGDIRDTPHDLSIDEVVGIVKALNNPSHLVYQTKNDRFAEIVKFEKNGGKNKAYAIIDFFDVDKNPEVMNGYEGGKYNILVTIYPSEDSSELKRYLKNKDNIVITGEEMKKKGISQRGLGSFVPAHLNDLPFYIDSISHPDEKVKEMFSKTDSNGRELSEGQKEYFKDSTVRDEKGNLKVMYRGDSSEFTVFDKKKTKHSNLYGRGFYFTDSKAHAEQYGGSREFYLDIKNPLSPKQNVITKKQMLNFLKAIENDGEDYDLYNYGQDATAESVLNSVWGKGDFEMLQDINAGAIGDLVAAVELFNEVNGTTYDGIILPTETVTFKSEQAKLTSNLNPTKDKDMRFAMRENVEETRDLVAVHNLSAEKLLKTLKLGGIPMPSIAITRAREGWNNFGPISLVFGKDTIDPEFLRSNKVYSGDAWTPTYPRIAYKVNEKASTKIREKINALVPKRVQDDLGGLHLDSYNLENELNRNGDMASAYRYNYAMKYAFLKDYNVNIELPTKDEPLYRYGEVSNEAVISFAHKMVYGLKTVNTLLEQHSSKLMEDADLINGIASVLNEEVLATVEENTEAYQKMVENPLYKAEDVDLSTVLGMLEAARKYFHSNGKIESEIDYRNAKGKIDDYFNSNSLEKEYEYWIKKLFSDVIAKEGIRNNKDIFTPSGNRRSFEALHYEHTLENVVKAMKEEGTKGIGGFGGGNIFGAATREYGSVDDIKADAQNRMQQLPESQYKEIKKGFSDRLFELAVSLPIHKDSFSATDDAANMLIEAVSKFKTKSGIANYLRTESKGWANYSDYIVDDLVELVNDIRNMPVSYFEAKPQRAVGYEEIKAVIMPTQESYEDDLSEVKAEVEKLGIPVLEYEHGDNNARIKALNSLEEVRFSERNTEARDAEYLELAKDPVKNEARLREMVYEAAKEAGYTDDSSWRMEHSAPNSKEDVSLDKLKESGLVPDDFWEHPEWYTYSSEERESYYKVKKAIEIQEMRTAEGKRDATMWVYRAVDKTKNKREDYFRNGDWVTPSKEYAINEGKMNPNGYRIIKHAVSIKNLYWDGNSIAELGYDDGNNYAYADTLNNRKLLDPVTYSPLGNIIPLSKRFNRRDYDVHYSDRDNVSVYDIMGETDRILKENEKFKEEIERLNERLKIERKVTKGSVLNNNQLLAAAGHLRNISNSTIDKVDLARSLKDVYSFIAQSENLTWEEVFEKCYGIAESMLEKAKPEVMVDDYFKQVLKDIRASRISLSESQKKEAQNAFDKNWNRYFFNRVTIAEDGTGIDVKWQEWAEKYPDLFDTSISDGDMIVELYNIINTARDASEVVVEYDTEEQTRWLANEIYNQYWNVSPVRTTADKYDKQIKRLNAEHRRAMTELRDDYNSRLKEQHKADKEKYKELAQKIRERKDKEIALAKKHGKDMMDKYKTNAERKSIIQSITANALSLNDMLVKNSKDKHIPEVMRENVIALLQAIDFSSKKLIEKGEPTMKDRNLAKALRDVNSMLVKATPGLENALADLYGSGLDEKTENLVKNVDSILDTIGDKEFVLNKMSLEDLNELNYIVKVFKHTVNRVNKFHIAQHNAGISDLALQSSFQMDELGEKGFQGDIKKFMSETYWNNKTPYYAFKHYGEAAMKILNAFQDGQDKMAFLSDEVITFTNSTFTEEEARKWEKKTYDFTVKQRNGKERTFKMNLLQIMELYCTSKQEDVHSHLSVGGITIKEQRDSKVAAVRKNILLEIGDVHKILSKLDENPRAKEVADKLQEFMGARGAELGNEISMARWGIKQFGIKDYYPIKVSEGTVTPKNEKEEKLDGPNKFLVILSKSFTKKRSEFKPTQSIEIGSILDTFSNHMSEMIIYNSMALPVLDAYKWFNYKGQTDLGEQYGVEMSMLDAFGDVGTRYFKTLLEDISGSTHSVARDRVASRFIKNSKIASVGANLRVIALQPTSYHKALAEIDAKYLLRGIRLSEVVTRKNIKKAKKYCGIALWKSMGYYDINIGRGVQEKIKHAETRKDKLVELSMKGAGFADEVTWGFLWNACELEIRDKRKDLKVGSEEFYREVGKRLRDIIYATQVVDSTLTRSQMMRSPDTNDKNLTMFMSEPTLALNMVTDAFVTYKLDKQRMGKDAAKKKHRKRIARVLTAYTLTNAVAALVETAFDWWRDDDDDEEMNLALQYLINFSLDMGLVGKIPYFKEIISQLQGFNSKRTDTQWMQSAFWAAKNWAKIFSGDAEGQGSKAVQNTLRTISDVLGLPIYNAFRDIMATTNKLDLFTTDDLNEMFEDFFD